MDFISRFPFQGKLAAQVIIRFLLALTVECLVLIMPTCWSYSLDFFSLAITELFFLTASEISRTWGRTNVVLCLWTIDFLFFFFTGIHSHFISSWMMRSGSRLFCFKFIFAHVQSKSIFYEPGRRLRWSQRAALRAPPTCSALSDASNQTQYWGSFASQRSRWCQKLPGRIKHTLHTCISHVHSTNDWMRI